MRKFMLSLALTMLAANAHAHTSGASAVGFIDGVSHPIAGLDHILAMIAVGLWAAQNGGRSLWLVPASFVGMMLVGGLVGMSGLSIPMVEVGILGSVVILGLLVGFASKMPAVAGMIAVGLMAVFHGYAHGTEMPLSASPVLYVLGFMTATVSLHGLGIAVSKLLAKREELGANLVQGSGAAITVTGLLLFLA